jgi:hypothetical protein
VLSVRPKLAILRLFLGLGAIGAADDLFATKNLIFRSFRFSVSNKLSLATIAFITNSSRTPPFAAKSEIAVYSSAS